MDLYIYDESISLVGIIDEYSSLMWIRRSSSAGAFELYVPATAHNIAVLKPHCYIYRCDVDEAMYISTIKESKTDDESSITVSGYSLDGLFRKRKLPDIIDKKSLIATLEKCSGFGCNIVFLDPDKYDIQTIKSEDVDKTATAEDYMRYVLKKLECRIEGRLNIYDKQLEFSLKKPSDKSGQIIFSEDYDNLTNSVYEFSEEGCVNAIFGRCNYPDDDVEIPDSLPRYTIGSDNKGLSSNEKLIYIDPIIKEGIGFIVDVETGVASEITYKYVDYDDTLEALIERCNNEKKNYTENFTADVMSSELYRKAFDIGDTVSIQNGLRNICYAKPIEEVEETFDENGYSVSPTFGEPLKTIYDFIKY